MIPTFRPRNSCIAICLFVSGWWYHTNVPPVDTHIWQQLHLSAVVRCSDSYCIFFIANTIEFQFPYSEKRNWLLLHNTPRYSQHCCGISWYLVRVRIKYSGVWVSCSFFLDVSCTFLFVTCPVPGICQLPGTLLHEAWQVWHRCCCCWCCSYISYPSPQ